MMQSRDPQPENGDNANPQTPLSCVEFYSHHPKDAQPLHRPAILETLDESTESLLRAHNQTHLIQVLRELPPPTRLRMIEQLKEVPWDEMSNVFRTPDLRRVTACDVVKLSDRERMRDEVERQGNKAYVEGKVAVLMVAGGQGTRLGLDGPKGCFPLMPLSQKSIFQLHCEKLQALCGLTGFEVPFLIMTSPATDRDTRAFLQKHHNFGLSPNQIFPFTQGTVPTTDKEGRILLKAKDRILENPDGHGGCLRALNESGILRYLHSIGIQDIVYVQVDNVLTPIFDPFAVGLRQLKNCDMVTKVVKKTSPDERVGALVKIDEKDSIVEYSDLIPEQKRALAPDGSPLFGWGSPMMLVLGVDFLMRLSSENFHLPFHLAEKKVKALDGDAVTELIGVKREKFFFDIIPHANNIGLEFVREQEFAPVKNRHGEDSVDSARKIISDEYARWLRAAGVRVDLEPGQYIEVSPKFAICESQFVEKWKLITDAPKWVKGDFRIRG